MFGVVVLATVTAIGGGVIRDVLLREIPLVLRREIYALAAGLGAVLVCVGDGTRLLDAAWQVGTAVVVFGVRVLALRRLWVAPRPRWTEDQAGA